MTAAESKRRTRASHATWLKLVRTASADLDEELGGRRRGGSAAVRVWLSALICTMR